MDQPIESQSEHAPEHGSAFMHEESAPAGVDRDVFGNAPKRHADWSHRRGEPRVFTLLWMVYLMGATVLMFSSMASAYSISPEITRPAARSMLMVIVIGVSVLWPMVRFSQRQVRHIGYAGQGHVGSAVRDVMVIFIPMQAVIWPQTMGVLAGWSIEVVGMISALFLGWVIILAGVIALGCASIERNKGKESIRVMWMVLVMVIVFGAPFVGSINAMGASVGVDRPRVGWLLSPVTGLLEIVRDRRELGTSARVFIEQWRLIIALVCVGSALLLLARAGEVARSKYRA